MNFKNLLIKASELVRRRSVLVENIVKRNSDKDHFIIFPSNEIQYKTLHIPHPFHQNTVFYYYTGFLKHTAVLLMKANKSTCQSLLFIDNPSAEDILWNGPYPSKQEASNTSGIDVVYDYSEFMTCVNDLITNKDNSYLWTVDNQHNCPKFYDKLSDLCQSFSEFKDASHFIDSQRVFKSPSEIVIMRAANRIASEALTETIKSSKSFTNEQEILAKLLFEMNIRGSRLAYPPVIAGGSRANIIHYLDANQDIDRDDLLLVDVGADVLGYYSDITRTWPMNGKFSSTQAILYDILYAIFNDCVSVCCPDKSLHDMHVFMLQRMYKYLTEAGIIRKTKVQEVTKFCPHHIGHYLGLDIHDTPSVSTFLPLQPGMVFPLEPGLYFSENCDIVDPKFRGIGMRLEDDFLMTESGSVECLSPGLVRSRREIEHLCTTAQNTEIDNQFYGQ